MTLKDETPKTKEIIMDYIGKNYRRAKRRLDLVKDADMVEENKYAYEDDKDFVNIVERTLEDCPPTLKNILRMKYFSVQDPDWYKAYYTRSSYYRLQKKAVSEFLDNLDI